MIGKNVRILSGERLGKNAQQIVANTFQKVEKRGAKEKSAGIPTSEETDGCVWEGGAASLFLTNKHLFKISSQTRQYNN